MTESLRELSGGWNFRDVADGANGLRPGRLFRSGELSRLDDEGRTTLRQVGITDVADLRAAKEVARRGPGRVPDGIEVHLLPMPDLGAEEQPDGEAPHERAFRHLWANGESDESVDVTAARYMVNEYREFPTRNGSRQALRQVVTLLSAGRAVLTHCFAGKDRTGFIVALVLEAIGIDRDIIVADYLRSNDAVGELRTAVLEMVKERANTELTPEVMTWSDARLSERVLGVRPEYLAASRRVIDEEFGSLNAYLRAAGVSESDAERLREALLV
ncbi:tyrosine-protein phosphatase [Mycobacterium sp.]|uniref:tyrosine-protein phosphatase n=1 Tax=Mycobacterium sp. TaxID=1785 RepID=UPI00121F03CE|nr:tyrosine-protein phosphatase [Mycobacterium sp.]TAM68760.1 MAG: tyrosine-protein phosphatase [Mycobacterium sp.]